MLRALFNGIIEFYQRYHVRYLFAASDIVRLRTYKRVLKCLGEEVSILKALGYEREGVQMHMLYGEFKSYREAQETLNQNVVSA